jgi:hypothetical protein
LIQFFLYQRYLLEKLGGQYGKSLRIGGPQFYRHGYSAVTVFR